jgi:hypothetical protein
MFLPVNTGPPLATRRTGLPQVCASMQKNFFEGIGYKDMNMRNAPTIFGIMLPDFSF